MTKEPFVSAACPPGKYRSEADEGCVPCVGSSYSSGGAAACTPCEDGNQANEDKTACGEFIEKLLKAILGRSRIVLNPELRTQENGIRASITQQ